MSNIPNEVSDDTYAICPHCGHRHGEPWEFFSEFSTSPVKVTDCAVCGKVFGLRCEFSVTYITHALPEEEEANKRC